MKRLLFLLVAALSPWATSAVADIAQFDQSAVLHSVGSSGTNYQRGVNYSRTSGGAPTAPTPVPTTNQFSGFVSYGAVVHTASPANPNLPNHTINNQVVLVLRAAQVGASIFSKPSSVLFGGVIPPPSTEVGGQPLTGISPADYWAPEPFTTNDHAGAPYYWSPHAGAVVGVRPGPTPVTWKKAAPEGAGYIPAIHLTENVDYSRAPGGLYHLLTNVVHVVSGSPATTPRRIYWTEGVFRRTSLPVAVPAARVSLVNVIYTDAFPTNVTAEYVAPGQTFPVANPQERFQELRTLWYDSQQGQIFAYNKEGRVFLELLGEPIAGGVRRFLGSEIVDVFSQVPPVDLTTDLGDRIRAYSDESLSDSDLTPDPIQNDLSTEPHLYSNPVSGTGRQEYFAVRETDNPNDVLVHWLQAGAQGLRWPYIYARYQFRWPVGIEKYTHYVRPSAGTDEEAALTAVPLPRENAPAIQYQDQDPPNPSRGRLTDKYDFYTRLDEDYPTHRSLLIFRGGDRIAFERVFSWLDVNLKTTNFVGTLATNLTAVSDYFAGVETYPAALAAYQTRLAGYAAYTNYTRYLSDTTRGVNGTWKLYGRKGNATTGVISSWTLKVTTRNASGSQTITSFKQNSPVTLNDPTQPGLASPYPSTLEVNTIKNSVDKIAVDLVLQDNDTSVTDLLLVSPQGSVSYLMSDVGVPGSVSVSLNIEDAFSDPLPFNKLILNGKYRPTNYDNTELVPVGATGPIVTNLASLLLPTPVPVAPPAQPFVRNPPVPPVLPPWPSGPQAPGVTHQVAQVADRIRPPTGETGPLHSAGYIVEDQGNSFHPFNYKNPFEVGFDAAGLGAIIPVNAIPGTNSLDVWWFRPGATNDLRNLANGFKTVYWPALIGRYTVEWPGDAREIVMAGNDGSGPLDSLQAKGTIYNQPDPTRAGYNPNEEHALMVGGRAYALRDDLNRTGATLPAVLSGGGTTFSSEHFVLLDHTDSEGQPAMTAFRVLREKPDEGIVFDYIAEAGTRLQAPMPLPFMPPAVDRNSDNVETDHSAEVPSSDGDFPVGWVAGTEGSGSGSYGNYARFTYEDRNHTFWVMRGLHQGHPTFEAGRYDTNSGLFSRILPAATGVIGQPFTNVFHTSRRTETLVISETSGALPPGLNVGMTPSGVALHGVPASVGVSQLSFTLTDTGDGASVTNTLTLNVQPNGSVVQQGPLRIVSYNPYSGNDNVYVGRPAGLATPPRPTNSFVMAFYYKTQGDFAFPGIASPPPAGTIVPYLRPLDSNGQPASGSGDGTSTASEALRIVYRPVWPSVVPKLQFGRTLTDPADELPAVRGQSSVQILYQQSIALDFARGKEARSVILHDPTAAKKYEFKGKAEDGLTQVPDGILRETYQGKTFFPKLPPHLAKRFFMDPNVGARGALVFQGEFRDELFGEKYLLLNVLRGDDLQAVKDLCPDTPSAAKMAWTNAVDAMMATVVTKHESPAGSGIFVDDPAKTVAVAITNVIEVSDSLTAVDSYALSAGGSGQGYVTLIVGNSRNPGQTPAGDPVSVHVLKVGETLFPGELKVIGSDNPLSEFVSFQHTPDLGGNFDDYEYEWKISPPVDGNPPESDATMSRYQALVTGNGVPRFTLGGSGIQSLVDNYLVMRYRPKNSQHPLHNHWSEWTEPQLAEGWIKRVLAGINPFNQRVTDLYNHTVNTDANILTSAGRRWEGDVALNLESINNYGLIEIYETVLRRGKDVSIDAGINFGPANDALLLAAGYLSDLYMLVGNEAYADASNPTIGIGTKDHTYGDIATSLFAFKGQAASLLEEELALLRGRDDVAQPGVTTAPVYNRLVWNFTRGIDSGEVIYALNYNILEQNGDGKVDAADAATLYPQGHGDSYGHFLTAAKGHYSLLMNNSFDWVPRAEAVLVLGKPVSVDYLDERRFATAAAAMARTGRQIFDLTWRKDYEPGHDTGWARFSATRKSARKVVDGVSTNDIVREWGADQWASRTGQGALFSWVVGNAVLPAVDPNPSHEGIQKIDRTTVPELRELAETAADLQTALDNAEGGLTPLGLAEGSLAFDLNPNRVAGANPETHFEQVYGRTVAALNNAVASFDDAKDVTRLMRSEQDSLADLQASVAQQELAHKNALINLYGTPYSDDIGPGRTWVQGYDGPDLVHYAYVDFPEKPFPGLWNYVPAGTNDFYLDIQDAPSDWATNPYITEGLNIIADLGVVEKFKDDADKTPYSAIDYTEEYLKNANSDGKKLYIPYHLEENLVTKPPEWTGRRASPGRIQQAHSRVIAARASLRQAMADNNGGKQGLDRSIRLWEAKVATHDKIALAKLGVVINDQIVAAAKFANETYQKNNDLVTHEVTQQIEGVAEALPKSMILGTASGGDLSFGGRQALLEMGYVITTVKDRTAFFWDFVFRTLDLQNQVQKWVTDLQVAGLEWDQELRSGVTSLVDELSKVQASLYAINARIRDLDDAERAFRAEVAEGNRLQAEQEVIRKRTAAVIQGFRTRDAAFRIFRNEKLERYKTLFDLAARYAYLAANAYDYETGLLGTDSGRSFVNRIVSSRALGVVKNGEPQYAGSDNGDPGLSSALAEMKADWDVLKGRLGFNNPDAYGTTVSLRTESLRILPGSDGDAAWQDALQNGRLGNLLEDSDVRRYCQQIDSGSGLPVPGIVLTFATTISPGQNLFGKPLAAGDSAFHRSTFATKISAVGVALEGYRGMRDPSANTSAIGAAGGISSPEPSLAFLDPKGLSATPYVYLIPVGVDSMRSPPLGDSSAIRSWTVDDVAIPLPFNIGASDFSTKGLYQSSDSLTEPLFAVRKHQAFRPVSTASAFSANIYGGGGTLQPSQYTNRRLIGRSVWNSQWKLVIPADSLLADPKEGLDRLIQTLNDVKLHLVTYGYSGN